MEKKLVKISTEYITLGQLLKFLKIVGQGSEVKRYLAVNQVTVNGEDENRRGRKLRVGDVVSLPEGEFEIV
jgi:S4 domain protein YaaA